MWIVCITSVRHVLTVNGYGGRQTKENEKSWCFKGWETLVLKTRHLQHILKDERLFSKISGEEKTKKQPDYCPETHYSVYLLTNNKLHELKSQET